MKKITENPLIEMFKILTTVEYKPKICQHIYTHIKCPITNAQCTIKVKGDYCSKHKID